MPSPLVGLTTAVVAGFFGAFINEMYKRHRDACATAAALAGELASYREAFESLDYSMPVLLTRVQAGEPLNIPPQEFTADLTFQAYVDKLGLLGPDLAERTAYVYGRIRGFRSVFQALTQSQHEAKSELVEASLRVAHSFSRSARQSMDSLVPDLRTLANRSFPSDVMSGVLRVCSRIWKRRPIDD